MTGSTALRAPLAPRLLAYLRERFPLGGFAPLIAVFTFSSAAYSRLARGAPGFIPWPRFVVGALTALVFFFLLRVLDEHKDADVDRRFRPELPVPRGLVRLSELRVVGGTALGTVLLLNLLVMPALLWACAAFGVWATLMTKEFFVRDWLRAHAAAYLVTHMAIMPVIDAYTTGLDWIPAGVHPPPAIWLFLAVTFLNGIVIEIGRKLRAPEREREGVDTYTRAWGVRAAPIVWLVALAASACTAWFASRAIGHATLAAVVLGAAFVLAAFPAARFIASRSARAAEHVERASQAWPLLTYLLLGAAPFVVRAIARWR